MALHRPAIRVTPRAEYEGVLDVDDRLVADLVGACRKVAEKIRQLPSL
jgi:hypothetical protein